MLADVAKGQFEIVRSSWFPSVIGSRNVGINGNDIEDKDSLSVG